MAAVRRLWVTTHPTGTEPLDRSDARWLSTAPRLPAAVFQQPGSS